MSIAIVLAFALIAVAALGQEFRPAGYVKRDCEGVLKAYWTNTPPHVFVQATTNGADWFDVIENRRIAPNGYRNFSYPIPTEEAVVFYRLRIAP